MKAYTDLEQSKKLAKILPLESADLYYDIDFDKDYHIKMPTSGYFGNKSFFIEFPEKVPCWSLAALLDILPNSQGRYTKSLYWFDNAWHCEYIDEDGAGLLCISANNALDACYKMIIILHELNLL